MTSQNIKVLLPPEKKTVVWQFGYCILKHIETFFYMWYLYIILPLFDVSSFLASFSRSSFVAGLPWWRQCCRMKTSRMGWWRRRLGDSCLLWQVVAEWDKTSVNCRTLPGSGAMARPVTSKAHWPGIVGPLNASKIFRVYDCWITSFWVATSDLSDWSGWSGWRQINSPTWWGKLGPQKSEISSELRQALAAFVATTQLLCFAFHQNTIVQYQYQIVSPPIYKEKKNLSIRWQLSLTAFSCLSVSCSLLSPVRLDFVESMSGRERFERGAQNPENGMKASSSKMGLCLRSMFLTRLKTWKLRFWANITQWAEGTVRVSPASCASFDSCVNFSFLSSGAFVYICFAWIHMDFPWFTLQVTGMPETRLGFSYVLHCASNIFSQMLMAERLNFMVFL
jgi:hypothetical protein